MSTGVSAPRRLHAPVRQRCASDRLAVGALAVLAAAALVVGAAALPSVDLLAMNDLGLVSVLPPQLLLAVLAVTVGFLVTLSRPRLRVPLVVAYLALLLVALYGLPAIVAEEAGHHVAWRHAGIVDYIVRQGAVDGTIDAYFNWPGFFILVAFVTQAADAPEVLAVSNWAPVFFNLLYLGPLLMIFRTACDDRRVVWLAIGLFYLTNWVGQDYFAPQALTYFLYLSLMAVLLRWFTAADCGQASFESSRLRPLAWLRLRTHALATASVATPPRGHAGASSWERAALLGAAVLLFVATVPTHQLTPFAACLSVGLLVLLRRCYARALPVLMAVITLSWIAFMTVAYLEGHLEQLLGGVGDLATAADDNVGERVGGSAAHQLVVKLRLLETGGLWLLAAVGAFLRFRSGSRDGTLVALALAPFPLIALQSYGGEMLLRVYLFSLPFVAFFVATLLSRVIFARRDRKRLWRSVALGAAAVLLAGGFFVARYGNERTHVFSTEEVAAVERLYEMAPPDATLVAGAVNVPWKAEHYERYDHGYVTETAAWERMDSRGPDMAAAVREVAQSMRTNEADSGFLLTSQRQHEYVNLLGPAPPGSLARFERAVARSDRFRLRYENADARIWELRPVGHSEE